MRDEIPHPLVEPIVRVALSRLREVPLRAEHYVFKDGVDERLSRAELLVRRAAVHSGPARHIPYGQPRWPTFGHQFPRSRENGLARRLRVPEARPNPLSRWAR